MLKQFLKTFNQDGEIYLRVKARPNAAATEVRQLLNDEEGEIIKIDIGAPAVKNRANLEMIKFLAREFDVAENNVKIIGGAGARLKLVKIIRTNIC